jgi:hypothetical protein
MALGYDSSSNLPPRSGRTMSLVASSRRCLPARSTTSQCEAASCWRPIWFSETRYPVFDAEAGTRSQP